MVFVAPLSTFEVSMKRALALVFVVFCFVATLPLGDVLAKESREDTRALCQIHCLGSVSEELSRVSISVTHGPHIDELQETSLIAQLHAGTPAVDVLRLLADRLERAGALVTRPEDGSSSLFVEGVFSVRIEDMVGLETAITFCDRPLGMMSLKRVRPSADAGKLSMKALLVDSDGDSREFRTFGVGVTGSDSGHTVCERFYEASLAEGWLPFRAQTDQWSPNRRKDSKAMESTEISLNAEGWALLLTSG